MHVPISPPNGLLLLNAGYDRLQARDVYMDAHALELNTKSVVRDSGAASAGEASAAEALASTQERPAKRQKQQRRKGTLRASPTPAYSPTHRPTHSLARSLGRSSAHSLTEHHAKVAVSARWRPRIPSFSWTRTL